MRCKLNYPIHNLRTTVNAKLIYGFKETEEQYKAMEEFLENDTSDLRDEFLTPEELEKRRTQDDSWCDFYDDYNFKSNGYEDLLSPRCDEVYGISIAECYVPLTAELETEEYTNIEETERFKEFVTRASKFFDLTNVQFHLYLMLSIEDGVGDICIGFDDDDN